MALFDDGSPKTLEDVLGQSADTASMGIENAYAKKRRRTIGQEAAKGRLRSGVANYTMGDVDAAELEDLGGVQSSLAEALGQIPTSDYLDERQFGRQSELAELIARLNKPSTLEEVFGGIGAVGNIAATGAAFL
jgi:hypothetical protein